MAFLTIAINVNFRALLILLSLEETLLETIGPCKKIKDFVSYWLGSKTNTEKPCISPWHWWHFEILLWQQITLFLRKPRLDVQQLGHLCCSFPHLALVGWNTNFNHIHTSTQAATQLLSLSTQNLPPSAHNFFSAVTQFYLNVSIIFRKLFLLSRPRKSHKIWRQRENIWLRSGVKTINSMLRSEQRGVVV